MLRNHARSAARSALLAATLTLLASSLASPAEAQCASTLQSHVNWLEAIPQGVGDNELRVTLVSNNALRQVKYAHGTLTLNAAKTHLVGTLETFASNALWADPSCAPPAMYPPGTMHPFNPASTASTPLSIHVASGAFSFGSQSVTAPECSNLMLRGQGKAASGLFGWLTPYFVLSFSQVFVSIPQ